MLCRQIIRRSVVGRNYALFSLVSAKDVFGESKASADEVAALSHRLNKLETRLDKIEGIFNDKEYKLAKIILCSEDKSQLKSVLHSYKQKYVNDLMTHGKKRYMSDLVDCVMEYNKGYSEANSEFHITKEELTKILNAKKIQIMEYLKDRRLVLFGHDKRILEITNYITEYNMTVSKLPIDNDIKNLISISDGEKQKILQN